MKPKIRLIENALECGFTVELGSSQFTLTAIRGVPERPAHVVLAVSQEDGDFALELSKEEFLSLLSRASSPFLEAITHP